jgi:hypothetical protein
MASKLTKIAQEKSQLDMKFLSKKSITWIQSKMNGLNNVSRIPSTIKGEASRHVDKFEPGHMYFFAYGPKGKNTLPYYDKFPLVLILKKEGNEFLGLNLHYLPIEYRVAFLDKLLDFAVYNKNHELQRIRVTYDILSASRRFKEFRPCIKKYLLSHVQSKILAIQPHEWEVATFLPVQQFAKEKPKVVWDESVEEIRNS